MTVGRIPSVEGGIQPTLLTAKGDLISATAASTVARLPVGSDAQILVADSTASTGLKWATPASGGKVLQVVFGQTSTLVTTASTTFQNTGLTATITPSSATSKVLVMVTQAMCGKGTTGITDGAMRLKLFRSTTEILSIADGIGYDGTTALNDSEFASCVYLDSPSTTSATEYKTQFRTSFTTTTVVTQNYQANSGTGTSTIILMEIGA